ncbi:MAG: lysostaphin resistance A-like protein [Ilyomonas sp.]
MTQLYDSRTISPLSQFGILIGLFFGGLVFGGIATLFLVKGLLNVPLTQLAEVITNPANVQAARLIQVVGAFFMLALPAFIFALIVYKKPFEYLGFSRRANARQFFFVLLMLIASFAVVGALAELNQMIPISKSWQTYFQGKEDEYNKQVMALARMDSPLDYIWALLILALLPAIFEEMFFRGALQQVLIRLTHYVFIGIFITSILFSLVHASYYGFLPRLFLGMLLGYIFYYSKNIWLNVALHFLNNAIAITQMYMLSKEGKLNAEALNQTFPLYYGIIGFVAVLAIFVAYKRESERFLLTTSKAEAEKNNAFNIE